MGSQSKSDNSIPTLTDLPSPPAGKTGWPWTEGSEQCKATMSNGFQWPRISIVTPSFNQADFIEETIRSILLQGYPNLEYMIMDGGSTDGSKKIIGKYALWLSYWVSEPDRGQSNAINKGWDKESGEICAWLNSDDIYEMNAFRLAAEYFAAHEDIDMIYGNCQVIDENGVFQEEAPKMEFDLKALVCNKWFISQPATFIRKQALEKAGRVNEDLHLVMDWELFLRIALTGSNIAYYPKPLARFRIWSNAKTPSQAVKSSREKLEVLDTVFSNENYRQEIETHKKDAYGYVHQWAGNVNYRNNNSLQAIYHYRKAIAYQPERRNDSTLMKNLNAALTGQCLYRKFKRFLYNYLKTKS